MAAQPQVSVRLGIEGAEKAIREFERVGAGGKKALDQIDKATAPASNALRNLATRGTDALRTMAERGRQALNVMTSGYRDRFMAMTGELGLLGKAMKALGPIGTAVAAAVGAVVFEFNRLASKGVAAVEKVHEAQRMAQEIGMDSRRLAVLKYSYRLSGGDPEELVKPLGRLQDALGDVALHGKDVPKEIAYAFGKLGISYKETAAHADDAGYMLDRIREGLAKLPNEAERIKLGRDIFGRQFQQLLPWFKRDWAADAAKAQKLGQIVSPETKKEAEEVYAKLADQKAQLSVLDTELNVRFARNQIALNEMEILYKKADLWAEHALDHAFEAMGKGWSQLWDGAGKVWGGFSAQFTSEWAEFSRDFNHDMGQLADTISKGWDGLVDRIVKAWEALPERLKGILPDWAQRLLGLVETYGPNLPAPPEPRPVAPDTGAPGVPGATIPHSWPTARGGPRVYDTPAGPPQPSALPGAGRAADVGVSGQVDINVRGPAEVRRVRSRGPIRVGVHQGPAVVGY